MSKADEMLRIGANLSVICCVLSLVFFIANLAMMSYNRLNNANETMIFKNVNSYATFENKLVSGDSVQYFIKDYSGRLFIRVTTEKAPTGVFGKDLQDYKNVEFAGYVNPTCKYFCTLLYDHNGDVIGANFEQDGVDLTPSEFDTAIVQCRQKIEEDN